MERRLEQEAPLIEQAEANRKVTPIAIRLGGGVGGGESLVRTGPLTIGYDKTAIVRTAPITLGRGQKIVIAGPNGAGKSTLLRTLVGELSLPSPASCAGTSGPRAAYYAQGHEGLDRELTVLETVQDGRAIDLTRVRALLSRFGFESDDIGKKAGVLSGGEKSRLALARLALTEANLLLLDEPTNHLDPRTRATLLDVLAHFGGAIVVTSHDEELLETARCDDLDDRGRRPRRRRPCPARGGPHLTPICRGWGIPAGTLPELPTLATPGRSGAARARPGEGRKRAGRGAARQEGQDLLHGWHDHRRDRSPGDRRADGKEEKEEALARPLLGGATLTADSFGARIL